MNDFNIDIINNRKNNSIDNINTKNNINTENITNTEKLSTISITIFNVFISTIFILYIFLLQLFYFADLCILFSVLYKSKSEIFLIFYFFIFSSFSPSLIKYYYNNTKTDKTSYYIV